MKVEPDRDKTVEEVYAVMKRSTDERTGKCFRCGRRNHTAGQCPHIESVCYNCGKKGHIQRTCRQPRKAERGQGRAVRRLTEDNGDEVQGDEEPPKYTLQQILSTVNHKPIQVEVSIDGQGITMESDTGAAVSLVSEITYKRLWPKQVLTRSTATLTTYSGEVLKVIGKWEPRVCWNSRTEKVPLVVLKGNGPSLLGRDWLDCFKINWDKVLEIKDIPSLEQDLENHKEVFSEELGLLKGVEVKLALNPEASPKFCKARPVPYAMRERVEIELRRLEKEGILEPIEFSNWAAPIVAVLKSDGKVRICGDFRVSVNPALKLDRYPIPKVEDLLATLAGGKSFTKLDLNQAYTQLALDEESKELTVINTHKGLFRYTRLPFGVSSAPGIFQRNMETLLLGIPSVVVYIDDILITGHTNQEHLDHLHEVLQRLEKGGMKLKKSKCVFMMKSVVYLGHKIESCGISPVEEKVKAVHQAPDPTNVTELKSYLGLLTYYNRFLPTLAATLAPLYQLLKQNVAWKWNKERKDAFEASKRLLTSTKVLTHFDPAEEIVLACDAFSYGVGAVLSHTKKDGKEQPIAFVSRTLNSAERKYSQIEREALACVYIRSEEISPISLWAEVYIVY